MTATTSTPTTDLATIRQRDEQYWPWRNHDDQTTSGAAAINDRRALLEHIDDLENRMRDLKIINDSDHEWARHH